eukprot:570464-Rhodomonas_salina.1
MLISDSRTWSSTSSESDDMPDLDFDSSDEEEESDSEDGPADTGGDFEMSEEDDSDEDNTSFLNLLFFAELSLNGTPGH